MRKRPASLSVVVESDDQLYFVIMKQLNKCLSFLFAGEYPHVNGSVPLVSQKIYDREREICLVLENANFLFSFL